MRMGMSQPDLSDVAIDMYYLTDTARRIEVHTHAQTLRRKSGRASRSLMCLAIVNTLVFVTVLTMPHRAPEDAFPLWLVEVILGGLTAAFWGLWAWSLVNPLPAAILGLLLYTSMAYASVASSADQGRGAVPFPTLSLTSVILLGIAIYYGAKERRFQKAIAEGIDPNLPRKRQGIASAIWLYVALLSIVVVPLGMSAEHDYTLKDQLDVMKFMGIVIVTWGLVSWRETRPAIQNLAKPQWYGLAIMLGLMTSVLGSLYGQLMSALVDFKPPGATATTAVESLGWPAALLMIAAFPAFFEEVAFRGVIVPVLKRALTVRETVFVSGAMFMILHLNPMSAPVLLAAGIMLGYLRIKSGSVWPCVMLHFTHNALILLFEFIHF
jgi:membrane protease YdiL (CAAX protease family)